MKTDAQLQLDVMAELKWEPSVEATEIGVSVKNGIVTLSGNVPSYADKWHAERTAQGVAGVKALAMDMKVALPGLSRRSDADIAQSVEDTLLWTTAMPKNGVKVMVEGGWVTLTGEVAWHYQKETAAFAVRHLRGVTGVSNEVAVRPTMSILAVKADIEAALRRRAQVDSDHIEVALDGADITLTGTVHSWQERDLATHSAWNTPGVQNVYDRMTLA